ncbi:hypothetical protein ACWGLG_22975 [Streptomyces antimycoticus]
MTEPHTGMPAPSTAAALLRALTGGLVMATALGVGTAVGPVGADALGLTGFAARVLPGALVTAPAVPLVLLLVRRGRRSPAWLGLGGAGASLRALLTGVGVTAAAAALVLGAGTPRACCAGRVSSPPPSPGSQRGRDPAPGAAGRPGDDGDTSVQCIVIECPAHPMSVAEQRVHTPDGTAVPDQPCWPGE